MKLILIGGGDLAQQLGHYIRVYDKTVDIIGFVDDTCQINSFRYEMRCLGGFNSIYQLFKDKIFDCAIFAIGYKHLVTKEVLYNSVSEFIPFYTFIHPKAYIDNSASIGAGCFVGPNSIIEQRVKLCNNVFIYGGVNISHDSVIGNSCFIAPSVSIAGYVELGSSCFVGINATITDSVRITDNVFLGASSLVLTDIQENGVYIGSPVFKKTKHI